MPTQDDYPDTWDCDSDQKRVRVDVLVRGNLQGSGRFADVQTNWITIPTMNVETHINKDGTADIQKNAKVTFPLEWDGESVLDLIQIYGPLGVNDITFARIYYYHEKSDQWIINHFGFVGGVGAAHQRGTGKFWVYDMAELMDGVPADFRFVNPTFDTVLEEVSVEFNDFTPAQLLNPVVVNPQTEQEVIEYVSQRREEQSLRENIAEGVFGGVTEAIETLTFGVLGTDGTEDIGRAVLSGYSAEVYEQVEQGDVDISNVRQVGETFNSQTVETGIEAPFNLFQIGGKTFKPNRDTLVDVMDWIATRASAKWHVEPTEVGGKLVLDISPTRRPFVQDVISDEIFGEPVQGRQFADVTNIYDDVRVIDNNALYDINPINTVTVRGDYKRGHLGIDLSEYDVVDFIYPEGSKYPYVTASAEPLTNRTRVFSGSNEPAEMTTTILETEDTTLGEAEASARQALKEALSQSGEGEILIYGNPKIMPYDKITVYPTCAGNLLYTDVQPMTFEVEEVKHVKKSTENYITTLYVSVFIDEEDIVVESSYREAGSKNNE